jgi:hypothetical protein
MQVLPQALPFEHVLQQAADAANSALHGLTLAGPTTSIAASSK